MAPTVHPLRIQKNQTESSPSKMGVSTPRPLAEVGPMERRRNSPSFNQATGKIRDASPFDPSPYNPSSGPTSTRLFWQGRDPNSPAPYASENSFNESSPSPSKRKSIENLKRASRVKNSNMFARQHDQEYDPTSMPHIERPLASGRPLHAKLQSSSVLGNSNVNSPVHDDARKVTTLEYHSKPEVTGPDRLEADAHAPTSFNTPSKNKASPIKSSLSNRHTIHAENSPLRLEYEGWSDEEPGSDRQLPPGRVLHRHAKSVTFDSGPPQINEYEMTTPELSSVGTGSRESSYGSASDGLDIDGDSQDESFSREDSFDPRLEDAEKTPVVGPEDWRHMSPATAPNKLSQHFEDPFGDDGSPAPAATADLANGDRHSTSRTNSGGSTGDSRPLPPVPGQESSRSGSNSSIDMSDLAERSDDAQRSLPALSQPASASKSDGSGMASVELTLEERLRLIVTRDEDQNSSPGRSDMHLATEAEIEYDVRELSVEATDARTEEVQLGDMQAPQTEPRPRISRESILRKVKSQAQIRDDIDFNFSSPIHSSTPEPSVLDPDVPLPSTESMSIYEDAETSVLIKQEHEYETDVFAAPALYDMPEDPFPGENEENLGEESVIHHQIYNDDDESNYSRDSLGNDLDTQHAGALEEDVVQQDIKIPDPARTPTPSHPDEARNETSRMSLPEFASLLGTDDLDFGLQSFMSQSPKIVPEPAFSQAENNYPLLPPPVDLPPPVQRPITPEGQLLSSSPPNTPGELKESDHSDPLETPPAEEQPAVVETAPVPDPVATIKAPGGKLRARPSATPADLAAMAATRRKVSGQRPPSSEAPPIPERHRDRPSFVLEANNESSTLTVADETASADPSKLSHKRSKSYSPRKSLVKLDVPMNSLDEDLTADLTKEFDRMMENQKRGYLMRQNTKVIVASSDAGKPTTGIIEQPPSVPRGARSAGNSPRKPSHDRSKPWNVEPLNNKVRRKSIKDAAGSPRKRPVEGPVPPLPGKESNVSRGADVAAEIAPIVEEPEAGGERGRLFVKVVGVKDLELPLVKDQQSWFNLTLDNGIHCVQTAWTELGRNAPIGQEFELVVLEDLEFTLTLQTEPPQPPAQPVIPSPTKSAKPTKTSAFSRVFASPKKRREMEKKQQEEEDLRLSRQRQQEAQARRSVTQPTAWDLLHHIVARDGTFGRAYVSLKEHEDAAYGRPYNVLTDCFNEWAADPTASVSSAKSKRGEVQRRAPYRIGRLELQLFFVPKPKGAQDADLPKSLNACVRELKEAEANASRHYEGHLSQQGGDCPYWRRRFFKLDGTKLTAYNETTRQPRATINLAKASKLIDDRSALLQKEVSSKGGRRKSAFSEEEEGYMFVEEGFRVRFANGEIIDFYADSAAEKDGWMKALAEAVGRDNTGRKSWTDVVLAREAQKKKDIGAGKTAVPAAKATTATATTTTTTTRPPQQLARPTSQPTASSPRKQDPPVRTAPAPPLPIDKSPRHQITTAEPTPQPRRRGQNPPKSMIF